MDKLEKELKKICAKIPDYDPSIDKAHYIYAKHISDKKEKNKNNILFKSICLSFVLIIFLTVPFILNFILNNNLYTFTDIIGMENNKVIKLSLTDDNEYYMTKEDQMKEILSNFDLKFKIENNESQNLYEIYIDGSDKDYIICIDVNGFVKIIDGEVIYISVVSIDYNNVIEKIYSYSKDEMGILSINQVIYKLSSNKSYYIVHSIGFGHLEDEEIIIENEYNGLPVRMIDSYAFYCCSKVKSIYIPSNIEYIGEKAFSNCISLEVVFIEKMNITIDKDVFENCVALDRLEFVRKG